ncbi:MAG: UDP-N-acetylglucosamine--N-acetylmuramyl-(pentapeptide) pyrophosphoryl-undecaprenol N-acetylglucosamine transferase [Patescibacteria group bacterium]
MKIMIVGGHVSPALAVIDSLPEAWEVVFIGRKYAFEGDTALSLEYQEIHKRSIPFLPLTTARVQRSLSKHTLPSFAKFPYGFYQAVAYLRKEKPDVVLSFGGYLSVPVGYAAKILSIPLVIHEQTLEAGLANKLLGKVATRICISWQPSEKFFPKNKVILTGNPVKRFATSELPFSFKDKKLPLLYITGGSTGSHAINKLVSDTLTDLLTIFRVIHQTGDASPHHDFDKLANKRGKFPEEIGDRYKIEKFISPAVIGSIMREATLVVSRSGINTISELLYFGKPALLIPLPSGQHNEQLKNARFLKEVGLAEILPQENATGEKLVAGLQKMLIRRQAYAARAAYAQQLIHSDAAENIIKTITYVVRKTGSQEK